MKEVFEQKCKQVLIFVYPSGLEVEGKKIESVDLEVGHMVYENQNTEDVAFMWGNLNKT